MNEKNILYKYKLNINIYYEIYLYKKTITINHNQFHKRIYNLFNYFDLILFSSLPITNILIICGLSIE